MDYFNLLEKWAEYTNFDSERKHFNLNGFDYELHKANKSIQKILECYDKTGALAVIKAKITFERLLRKSSYNAYEYFSNPQIVKKEKEMWNLFFSQEVLELEKNYINSINKLTDKIINKAIIGERKDDEVLSNLFDATDIVINSLDKCNRDLFCKGGKILPVTKISTHIHLFETLADCLLSLENTDDGLYLCYINCNGAADGYFSFFLKSNGNLLSINERVDEAYVGQHSNCRNSRWTNGKQYELFPYNYIFDFKDRDYMGYATNHLIDDEKLAFFELGHKVYLPIIVAMLIINNQYANTTIDSDVVYVNSLLPANIMAIEGGEKELAIINSSNIVKKHKSIDLSFNKNNLLKGCYSKEFNYKDNTHKDYKEKGVFDNSNQLFVDLWGKGFEYSLHKIYATSNVKSIGSENKPISPEFVGSKDRIRMQGYYEIRKQLADYIRDKIYNEWVAVGKTKGIKDWYVKALSDRKSNIEKLVIEKYLKIKDGEKILNPNYETIKSDELDICYEERKYPSGFTIILNEAKSTNKYEYICPKTGATCNTFFIFKPKNWIHLELLIESEVPKVVKGWLKDGHFGTGNSILNATDLVTKVGTPFERYESDNYRKKYNEWDTGFDFAFAIGFSKRGLNQMTKEFSN